LDGTKNYLRRQPFPRIADISTGRRAYLIVTARNDCNADALQVEFGMHNGDK